LIKPLAGKTLTLTRASTASIAELNVGIEQKAAIKIENRCVVVVGGERDGKERSLMDSKSTLQEDSIQD